VRLKKRGTALATVLLASGVLLVVCMALGTMAILDLDVSSSYSMRSQSLLMAEAAVNQLIAEMDRAQEREIEEGGGSGLEMSDLPRLDLLARFRDPVFPAGANRFPGEVFITFDTRHQMGHYSVDNSYNEAPAAGWLDRGTSNRSVPPFSIDLLIQTKIGSRATWYQATLRRRWPYVLCTPGRVTLMGAPTYARDRKTTTVVPSEVTGNIFNLPGVSFSPSPPPDASPPPPPDTDQSIFVDVNLIDNLLGVLPPNTATVSVGGESSVKVLLSDGSYGPSVRVTSIGNMLLGSVDVGAEDPNAGIDVYPGNRAVGSFRQDVKPFNLEKSLQRAFQLPSYGNFREVPLQADPPGWRPEPVPGPESAEDPNSESTTPSPSPSPSEEPEDPGPPPFFVLYENLVLSGPPPPEDESFNFDERGCYRISTPAGNRYIVNGNRRNIYYTGKGIELHDCMLYIAGNLDLSSTLPLAGGAATVPPLRGNNATLIVDGTLIVNNGSLSGSEDGMVIYCRRLVTAAQGTYHGLIMVQKSAAICPAFPGAKIEIQGGIVCGGDPVQLFALNPNFDPEAQGGGPEEVDVRLDGLHLWSTHLKYDARYLKTLNRLGPLTLLALRQIE